MKTRFLHRFFRLSGPLFALIATAKPVPLDPETERLSSELRGRLVPVVETTLLEHCGEECPSFRIDPRFVKEMPDTSEDLGFATGNAARPDVPAPRLGSVQVTVLVQDRVSTEARQTLKQVLTYRVANEVSAPVSVQVKTLDSLLPSGERLQSLQNNESPRGLAALLPFVWPSVALLASLLAFSGCLLWFRHRRRMALEARTAATHPRDLRRGLSPSTEASVSVDDERFSGLLEARAKDLEWFLEERASAGDRESLAKVSSLCSADALASRISLDDSTLARLAELSAPKTGVNRAAVLAWLENALDGAHWKRLREERHPLERLARLHTDELSRYLTALPAAAGRATLLAAVPEETWPVLLGKLASEERIELGLEVANLSTRSPAQRDAAERELIETLRQLDRQTRMPLREGLLEDYSLYLSEKEARTLWQQVSAKASVKTTKEPQSVEALLKTLKPEMQLELCLRLEPKRLRLLLTELSAETRQDLLRRMPQGLRERLTTAPTALSAETKESELMHARAELTRAYRETVSG